MTRSRKTPILMALIAVLIVGAVVPAVAMGKKKPTIAEYLIEDGRFTTLLAAVEAAGLTDVFAGGRNVTLNAPTNAAFNKLPEGTVAALLNDTETLTEILTYHVYNGRKTANRLLARGTSKTLNGSAVFTYVEGETAYHNNAMISEPNIKVRKGMIHVIEDVLLPPEIPNMGKDMVEILQLDGRFTTLLAAVDAAGLTETLATGRRLVLNAPTDEAFAKLPDGTVESLLGNIPALTDILLYHVIQRGGGKAKQLLRQGDVETLLEGEIVSYMQDEGGVTVNDSTVIRADVRARGGWIHTIDTVLLPPSDD